MPADTRADRRGARIKLLKVSVTDHRLHYRWQPPA
jgi:hypothetical protein